MTRARLSLAAIAVLPAVGAFAVGSSNAIASNVVSSKSVAASEQAQTLAYWTPARRRAAKPVNEIAGSAPASLSAPSDAKAEGPPSTVAGTTPNGAPSAAPASQPVLTAQPWSYPFPYDAFAVSTKLYKTYPYALNGTIFFTNNGLNFKCSGTSVVNGHQASEVWTAGHCVANTESGNMFDSFAEFIPAYNGNGKLAPEIEPYGTFVANGFTTATEWINNHNLAYDYGAMTLNKSQKKRTLSGSVGTDGYAWNFNENEQYVQFGYPGESPYNGTKMEENIAATAVAGPGVGSPFTGGSSGGGWNIDWAGSAGSGYINGHTDYYFTSEPLTKYSPYIGTLANEVRCLGKPAEC